MQSKLENLIEISGISDTFPSWSKTFKQLHLQEFFKLDPLNPDIQELLRTFVKAKILNTRIIKTSKGISREHQALTELQLIIKGEIIENIEYLTNNIDDSLYVAQLTRPFCTSIILGKEFTLDSKLMVTPYIEDLYIKQISNRKLFNSVMFSLHVTSL